MLYLAMKNKEEFLKALHGLEKVTGSIEYLIKATGLTKPTVYTSLKILKKDNLLIKNNDYRNTYDINSLKIDEIINHTKELSNNIKTVPTFFEPQVEKVELSDDTKATFARIGARARREFIEEQTARAYQYNIPYDVHNVNFLELSQKIDEYEELLKKAKDYCIDWDTSEYDPVYLRQEIEEQERKVLYENDDLYAYFVHSRGLEA
ncbi:unnamed protein product [Rotaria magnacalcarata]|uniref:Uncharacterized protein n=1 Tax=Rotaria magnacalcarata TaxID=392030 RepID=A0A820A184_9BILA|nr:unnamed protein product [Rotaria magnacalcarata]